MTLPFALHSSRHGKNQILVSAEGMKKEDFYGNNINSLRSCLSDPVAVGQVQVWRSSRPRHRCVARAVQGSNISVQEVFHETT